MMEYREQRQWKWLGAPHNGVLGLFTPQTTREDIGADHGQENEAMSVKNNRVEAEKDEIIEPPFAVSAVLLGMEVVMTHAVGMLLVWSGSMAKKIASRVLQEITSAPIAGVVAEIIYSGILLHGLTAFAMRMFKQSHRLLFLRRLGLFASPLTIMLLLSVVFQMLLLVAIATSNNLQVGSAVFKLMADAAAAPPYALHSILFAPVQEELMFRGVVFHLALNRLRSVTPSAFVNSVCFGAVHLANLSRSSSMSSVQVVVQVAWACVFGVLVSLRYAQTGSLSECIALHVVNNAFAAVLSTILPDQ